MPERNLYKKAHQLITQEKYDEALPLLEQVIAQEPTADAFHDYGMAVYFTTKDSYEAIPCFQKAIKADSYHHQSHFAIAGLYLEEGLRPLSVTHLASAVSLKPGVMAYKEKFLEAVGHTGFRAHSATMKQAILSCLKTDNIDCSHIGNGWVGVLTADPQFKIIYKAAKYKNYDAFRKYISQLDNFDALYDPYFLEGLQKLTVCSREFEWFLTNLRRWLLENASEKSHDDARTLSLIRALADYCFFTEYVFAISEAERKTLQELTARLENTQPLVRDDTLPVALLACYQPLWKLQNADAMSKFLKKVQLGGFAKTHIDDEAERKDIASDIPALTDISGDVSENVRAQYEQSPYPRWRYFTKKILYDEVEGRLKGQKTKILIAGCGTGKEAIEIALALPDADILAVDLSLASLSYGSQKAKSLNVRNITFKQADILGLGVLDGQYDFITSSGVLHHMEDPLAGWRVLTGLLKPDGLMRIALYSRYARQAVTQARKQIAGKGLEATPDDIRRFRANIESFLKKRDAKNLVNFGDFYTLSECRDLVFHVQEHQFDLPQIKQNLAGLGLSFVKFYLPDDVKNKYRKKFPNDPDMTELDNWNKFEKKYPATFAAMYRFWCEKS